MDYTQWTRDALIGKIDELTLLSAQLLREKQQETRLDYDWTGSLGHWYWNIRTNAVTFNPLKLTTLGYEIPEESAPIPYQFFTEKLHPDDYETTMTAMRNHLQGKSHVYETEYRIQAKDGSYHWFYDRGKITGYDEEGKPLFLAGIVFDITEKKRNEELLKNENTLLAEQSATDSLAGRYGGEEFILVFENAPLATAREICERIRTGVASTVFDNGITVTISGGVCEYRGESITEFIESADENLYEAKRSGRNCVV